MDKKLNYSRLSKEGKTLYAAHYTAEQIRQVFGPGGKWYLYDWRGKKGDMPQLGHIKATIKELLNNTGRKPNPNDSAIERAKARLKVEGKWNDD